MCKRFFILQVTLIVATAMTALPSSVSAQTVINMPPPPKKPETPVAPNATPTNPVPTVSPAPATASTTNATASSAGYAPSQTEEVGDLALARYARARSGTYDTYSNDGMYGAGIRIYSYPRYFPQFIWGPWWGFNFGFHSHSVCK